MEHTEHNTRSTQHAQEPWSARGCEDHPDDPSMNCYAVRDAHGEKVKDPCSMQRIVACVNALTGVEDPAEFVAKAKELIDDSGFWGRSAARNGQALAKAQDEIATLKAQRDELLYAAKAAYLAMDDLNNGGSGPLTLKKDIEAMLYLDTAITNASKP